jgi:ABC-type Fe3+/spermidine/putrescine transport system ATPase subunit
VSDPEEDFATLFEASSGARRLQKGQTVEGRIVAVGPEVALVDVGGKGEAEIDVEELKDEDGAIDVAVGDRVQAVVVATDGGLTLDGPVTDPDSHPAPGDRITVAIRPEHILVSAGDAGAPSGDGWTRIAGRVIQGTYLGDQTEYRIRTEQVGELVARRQNAAGAGGALGAAPGDPVIVRWHEDANLILVD